MIRALCSSRVAAALTLVPVAALFLTACGGASFGDAEDAGSDTLAADASGRGPGAPDGGKSHGDAASDSKVRDASGSNHGDTGGTGTSDAHMASHPDGGEDPDTGPAGKSDAKEDAKADEDGGAGSADLLASAKKFAVLAGSDVTITPPPAMTVIIGDVGVSPGTSVATLPPGQPVGTVYAGDPVALQAEGDLTTAYNTLAAMPCLPANNRTSVDLGGKTLAPGVYCFDTSAGLTGDLVLDAQLDPNATWVVQIGSTLTTATDATVSVINGGSACNVYWQIGSSATLGTGTQFLGNIVAATSITLVSGSTVAVGRTLARNGAVTMDHNTVSAKACQ
jgi:hypothetical protein